MSTTISSTIIGHVDPAGDATGDWSQSETEAADLIRRYTQLGKWDAVLALLRGYDPEARARIQAAIRADRRHRGWGHA